MLTVAEAVRVTSNTGASLLFPAATQLCVCSLLRADRSIWQSKNKCFELATGFKNFFFGHIKQWEVQAAQSYVKNKSMEIPFEPPEACSFHVT